MFVNRAYLQALHADILPRKLCVFVASLSTADPYSKINVLRNLEERDRTNKRIIFRILLKNANHI
ncbi:hypothetical protein [Bartonella sp. 1-1C]|uniref:hypothetical protein n=1 Tax=Bartonella sp. 1-1C TaxID=515256 RepID=UPI0001F4BBFD|nr:hypothetical protein [Bartonella sp. 1-1C]CBI81115.1 hypothetical protein B11C_120018 [Bartonella sp. 1-1C]